MWECLFGCWENVGRGWDFCVGKYGMSPSAEFKGFLHMIFAFPSCSQQPNSVRVYWYIVIYTDIYWFDPENVSLECLICVIGWQILRSTWKSWRQFLLGLENSERILTEFLFLFFYVFFYFSIYFKVLFFLLSCLSYLISWSTFWVCHLAFEVLSNQDSEFTIKENWGFHN